MLNDQIIIRGKFGFLTQTSKNNLNVFKFWLKLKSSKSKTVTMLNDKF